MDATKEEYGELCPPDSEIGSGISLIMIDCVRHFPKARVWPPLPQSEYNPQLRSEECISLPDSATQAELLEIYFAYVHPALPLLHKQSFLEEIRSGCDL
jgi:hypothetical protein